MDKDAEALGGRCLDPGHRVRSPKGWIQTQDCLISELLLSLCFPLLLFKDHKTQTHLSLWIPKLRFHNLYYCQVFFFFFLSFFFTFFVFFFNFFFICSEFCYTLKWNSHEFTCVPHPDPPSHLPLHPLPLGFPSAPGPSTCLTHPTWAGDLFHPR